MLKKFATKEDFRMLTKKEPEKSLLLNLQRRAGRALNGRITVRHKGGGAKRLYRIVDFGQEKINLPGKVAALEYDPYRTTFLALISYQDGEKKYRLAPQGLKVGDEVICRDLADIKTGNRMKIGNIPVGTFIFEVELEPGRGAKLMRSAGTAAKVLAQEGKFAQLEMPSSEVRQISRDCFATVGRASRIDHIYAKLGKAGTSRHKGRRPTVRGTAMNPVDHPHGGGEGKTPIGMKVAETPWGKPARGVKTRKGSWTDKYILQRRQKK